MIVSHTRRIWLVLPAGLAGLALALAACSPASESGDGTTETSHEAAEAGHGASEHADQSAGTAFGEPGEADAATRVIRIRAEDTQRFDPPSVDVALGETVRFEVKNTGALEHEFVIGDATLHAGHAAEMAEHAGAMPDEPFAVRLLPGQTREVVWRFTQPGQFEYGCHTPGHYEAGMKGSISVQ